MTWIINNIGTIITLIILLAIVALIIRHIKKDKAQENPPADAAVRTVPCTVSATDKTDNTAYVHQH